MYRSNNLFFAFATDAFDIASDIFARGWVKHPTSIGQAFIITRLRCAGPVARINMTFSSACRETDASLH
jgi:hypothetical protein